MKSSYQFILKTCLIALAMLVGLSPGHTQADTEEPEIWAILCGQTAIIDIGSGCQAGINKVKLMLEGVERETGMKVNIIEFTGNDFTKANIMTAVENLEVKPNDAIFFFGTSHGYNFEGNSSVFTYFGVDANRKRFTEAEFNQLAMSLEKDIHRNLLAKNARLVITIGEACNKSLGIPEPDRYRNNMMTMNLVDKRARYNRLFKETAGDFIATSSRKGEFSWTDPREGGIYINQFLKAFDEAVVHGRGTVSWDAIANRALTLTTSISGDDGPIQTPYHEADLYNTSVELIDEKPTATPQKTPKKKKKPKHDFVQPKFFVKSSTGN